MFGVEGSPNNYFSQTSSLESSLGDLLTWGYVSPDGKVRHDDYIYTELSFKTFIYGHQDDEVKITDWVAGWDFRKKRLLWTFISSV